ncbi:MAG: MFS transporter [archaeon]
MLSVPGIKPVLFTLFMAAFGFGVILPLLPFYALSLGAKPFELGVLTAVFALMQLIFSPLFGKLGDRHGRKKVLLIGTAGFAVSYIILAFADSFAVALFARALEGLFAASIFPTCLSLLSDFTTEAQRGKAMGLMGMTFSLGFIFGPAFGGLAAAIFVRDAFLLSALFSAINFCAVFFNLKEPKEKEESRDLGRQEVSLLSHLSSPMLFLFLSSAMITFMIGGIDATLALYTSEKMGFTSAQIGLVFTYIGILIMFMQFAGGGLVNRFGEIKLISAGLLLSGAGFFLLSFTHDWVSLLFPLAVFVAGNAMVFPSVNALITKKVSGKRGAVLGLNSSFSAAGQAIGPLFGGFLYGLNHFFAFIGLAAAIWLYFLLFFFFASKKLVAVPMQQAQANLSSSNK